MSKKPAVSKLAADKFVSGFKHLTFKHCTACKTQRNRRRRNGGLRNGSGKQ